MSLPAAAAAYAAAAGPTTVNQTATVSEILKDTEEGCGKSRNLSFVTSVA